MAERVLICEDEQDLQILLERAFRKEGWTPVIAADGKGALELLATSSFDALVLDLNLPEVSGLEICRRLRRESATARLPVIMLTARDEEIDRVVGFEVGADDYITKPFSVRELILRVQTVVRRVGSAAVATSSDRLVFGRLTLDPSAHRAWVDGQEIELTPIEYRMVTTFLEFRGKALTRDEVLAGTWGISWHITARTVDTHVKRLRAKLGPAGAYLETLRGVGYRWAASAE